MDLTFFQINYLLLQFVGANLHRLFPLDFKLAPASSDLFPETHQYCIDFYCFPAPQGEEKKKQSSAAWSALLDLTSRDLTSCSRTLQRSRRLATQGLYHIEALWPACLQQFTEESEKMRKWWSSDSGTYHQSPRSSSSVIKSCDSYQISFFFICWISVPSTIDNKHQLVALNENETHFRSTLWTKMSVDHLQIQITANMAH